MSLGVKTTVNPTVKVQITVCTTNGIKAKHVLHLVLRTDMAVTDASESQNFEEVVFATLLREIVLF